MQGRGSSLRTLRWAAVSLGLVLGAVLLVRGDVLIGGLVAGAAVLRVVYLLSSSRGRRRRPGPGGGGAANQGPVRQLLRDLAPHAFEVAGAVIGVDPAELRRGFQQGRSVAEAAAAKGVTVSTVVDAVMRDASVGVDRALANGLLSPAAADRARARLPMWSARMIYGTREEFQRTRWQP
ncbi:MAG: hypothetical protein ACLQNG_12755 [Acidimicrobiales bacterium]|jgi:hypothetical protein